MDNGKSRNLKKKNMGLKIKIIDTFNFNLKSGNTGVQ